MAAFFNSKTTKQSRRASKKNRKKRPEEGSDWFVNLLTLGLSALVLSFIWSFWTRHTTNTLVSQELALVAEQPDFSLPETLSAFKKYPHIKIEILNGCGISGIAAEYKNIIREKTFDVQLTGNAPNFNFETTQIIARSDNTPAAYLLAKELGMSESIVLIQKDETRRVDITLILGKDYQNIPAFKTFF